MPRVNFKDLCDEKAEEKLFDTLFYSRGIAGEKYAGNSDCSLKFLADLAGDAKGDLEDLCGVCEGIDSGCCGGYVNFYEQSDETVRTLLIIHAETDSRRRIDPRITKKLYDLAFQRGLVNEQEYEKTLAGLNTEPYDVEREARLSDPCSETVIMPSGKSASHKRIIHESFGQALNQGAQVFRVFKSSRALRYQNSGKREEYR